MFRILFLEPSPTDLEMIRSGAEYKHIDLARKLSPLGEHVELISEQAVQATDLQTHLLQHRPHIVHFSGHATVDRVVVEAADGRSVPVAGSTLRELFRIHRGDVRCLVLNACRTDAMAQEIAAHIPAVVGVPADISDEDARAFALGFYRALFHGKRSLRSALEQGRLEMQLALGSLALSDTEQPRLWPVDCAVEIDILGTAEPEQPSDQARYVAQLEGFLQPLDRILKNTLAVFQLLVKSRAVYNAGPHLEGLQDYFASMPDDDRRKAQWRNLLDLLEGWNREAQGLLARFSGGIVRDDFRQACDAYGLHLALWNNMWQALKGHGAVPGELAGPEALSGFRFPAGLQEALRAEMAAVRDLAGMT